MNILKNVSKLFFALWLIVFAISCGKQKKIVIKGTIANAGSKTLYLAEFDMVTSKLIDSVTLDSDGDFKFKTETLEPKLYQLMLAPSNFILLLVEPGNTIKLISDVQSFASNYSVEGSNLSLQVKELTSHMQKTRHVTDSLTAEYRKEEQSSKPDTAVLNTINRHYKKVFDVQRKFSIKFVIEHLKSLCSIVAIYQQFDDNNYVLGQNKDLQYIKILADTLKKYYPQSKLVSTLWVDRNRLLGEYYRMKMGMMANSAQQKAFPNLNLPNFNGDSISMAEIKAKYILLNFWNPGNKDCVEVLADLKNIYDKYSKRGFEIYNVALMTDFRIWAGMVLKSELAGINVIDLAGIDSYSAHIYNVTELPATYLIDKEKGPIAKNLFGKELVSKLDEILK